ncbi:MAG: HD domain-containing protein [Deltaproteobacteria bacterium]|nr:HD domain-containing protein [Deltaproteobacteria bacterium]MBW2018082.1 HD domain-containing protein [Deltaproteobacteria bacterium]MBW2129092.1 HD domain-containing protein [Deltaproteobacteria bacterium]MBW2304037.1 HD domain-containing protein [Deltaproteobacteria bacterium]
MPDYIQARKALLPFYRDVPLYEQVEDTRFVLYKPPGITLGEMRISQGRHPEILFLRQSDRLEGIREAQTALNEQLRKDARSGNLVRVKETIVEIVDETLREPRSGSLEGMADTVNILVDSYSEQPDVIRQLIDMSSTDYSTVLHSINVMAFSLLFAFYNGYSRSEAKWLGLSGLLHDVGKTRINKEILVAPRRLTSEEFEEMKRHTTIGYEILKRCRFENEAVSLCALEHHEKLDGSGYPFGKSSISETAQIIGIIDCYEALTNNDRPYRNAMEAFETLGQIIRKDVEAGKCSSRIFSLFVKSLSGK